MSQKKKQKKGSAGHPARAQAGAQRKAKDQDGRPADVVPVRHPTVSVSQAKQDLRASGQQQGSPGMLVIALIGATLFMFFYLHIMVLPQMSALSGGLPMPDHRFTYDVAALAELDASMNEAAHGQLNWVHKTAGVIFPLFVFACVSAVAAWCLPRGLGRWLSYAAGAVFAVVDIAENMLIESSLDAGGEGAGTASLFTSARWVLLVAIALWVVLMILGKVRQSVSERKAEIAAGSPKPR
ncbi:hypothetical protein [Citricoccus muralis]|uniref:Uncharacterized protein n=1 Tax=Citricoccus muralis TaxID=169134 RepID=A0A3D9LFD7_9MICC|nr:hypothetical protein [Citricoccus muralis]REE05171.1 hypothetical protein C8E99_3042 [Citricoccus muralis]